VIFFSLTGTIDTVDYAIVLFYICICIYRIFLWRVIFFHLLTGIIAVLFYICMYINIMCFFGKWNFLFFYFTETIDTVDYGSFDRARQIHSLTRMCDVTHSYVWHDPFICVTKHIRICDLTRSFVWLDSFTCVTWLIHMCDIPHSYVWYNSIICEM